MSGSNEERKRKKEGQSVFRSVWCENAACGAVLMYANE